jgi:hypothetical protein
MTTEEPIVAAPKKRKKSSTSPTQRTLAEMRKRGFLCAVVEKWNPHARIRQDLFGFIDILCVGNREIVGVQACNGNNGDVAERIRKIADHDNVGAVREAGIRILVHGWAKRANGRYELREVDVS